MEHRLLIVDDDPDVLDSLSELLQDEGFTVKTVSCGEDVFPELSRFNPSVIISDMNMTGISGLELLRKIREINSHIQIIILTGYASVRNASDAMSNNGAFAYFQKPITDFDIFFTTIHQAFEKERLLRENHNWEERLKIANARFETIFESMDAVIYVADINTYEIIYANSKFKSLFGEYSNNNKKCWEILQKSTTGPCPFCTNSKIVDKNGKPSNPYTWEFYNPTIKKWFSIMDQAIYWHDGRVVRLETAMDITQYYKLSREVEKSRRFQAIGVLAGGIAHDLNNNLAAIMANINLAQILLPDSNADECLVAAEHGIIQAKNLSEKLLAIARGDTPVKDIVNMRDILTTFIRDNKFESQITFLPLDEENSFDINADVDQIKTVLYNVFINASEAMKFKGTIQVELKRFHNSIKNCDYIVTSIHDNGRGIAVSDIEKVFDPYFSSKFPGKEKGTGLGLSMAYSIIKNHGGYIDIDSVEGQGTRVDICIPAVFF